MSENETELGRKAPHSEIKKIVAEFSRQSNHASDYAGTAGQYLKNQVERTGISAKVFRTLARMEKTDEAARQSIIRQTIHGWRAMGYLDQIDLFDDLRTDLRAILEGGEEADGEAAASGEAPAAAEAPTTEGEGPKRGQKRGSKKDPTLDSLVH